MHSIARKIVLFQGFWLGGLTHAKTPKPKSRVKAIIADEQATTDEEAPVDPLAERRNQLAAAGWTVLPEISEQVDTGQLWVPSANPNEPHRREFDKCIDAEPTEESAVESSSTGSGNIELKGGGGMGVRVQGRYESSRTNEVVITDARTRVLDGARQVPTEDCYTHLTEQKASKDISTWYVVTETFRATVTNSDARGRAGSLEVSSMVASGGGGGESTRAQTESTSGTLAYRSVPAAAILQRAEEKRAATAEEEASLTERINQPGPDAIVGFAASGVGEEDIAGAVALTEQEQIRQAEAIKDQNAERMAETARLKEENEAQNIKDAARREALALREAEDAARAARDEAALQGLIDDQIEKQAAPVREQANQDFELIRQSMDGPLTDKNRQLLVLFLKKYGSFSVTVNKSDGTQEEVPVELSTVRMVQHFLNDRVPLTEPNTIGLTFAELPPGHFWMGCTPGQGDACADNETRHRVDMRKMIAVATTEVTQKQWETVMGENQASALDCGPDCPVENVSWKDAVEFANRLSSLEDKEECYVQDGATFLWPKGLDCTGYRLLTEAEWEYAARANADLMFAGSAASQDVAWTLDGSAGQPEPVATLAPNGWHLHDMSGNVWEWVWDGFGELSEAGAIDPLGDPDAYDRVCRGGSWYVPDDDARISRRVGHRPGYRSPEVGFRLARSIH